MFSLFSYSYYYSGYLIIFIIHDAIYLVVMNFRHSHLLIIIVN